MSVVTDPVDANLETNSNIKIKIMTKNSSYEIISDVWDFVLKYY